MSGSVLGTLREPLLGWVDNVHNGAFAFIAGAGKGVFRTILADGNKVADMVPCDQVVNLIISAASHVSFRYPVNLTSKADSERQDSLVTRS